jgi:hypothetical protein
MSEFRVEVIADLTGEWCGNGLTFPGRAEAEAYACDLACRWTAVRDWRVVPVEPATPSASPASGDLQ